MPPRRIRAPDFDRSALIRDNALTLIGRVTNPKEQPIGSLISALPRKWSLKGHAFGSDLGQTCFQFRFELEEDLTLVLNNRPYNYNNWMLILQRWEPVISPLFPSQIPFWIKLQGLPLHFWHEKMIYNIGQDLGTLEDYKITKTAARIKISVDGLKPLIKETIIDFDSGEELPIYLEYEDLGYHCHTCNSLTHLARNCPTVQRRLPTSGTVALEDSSENGTLLDKDDPYKARVDRHGKPFGERVPLPGNRAKPLQNKITPALSNASGDHVSRHARADQRRSSPSRRSGEHTTPERHRAAQRYQYHNSKRQRSPQQHWREKTHNTPPVQHRVDEAEVGVTPLPRALNSHDQRPPLERNLAISDFPKDPRIPTTEQVMNELREVSYQYTSVADPTESAARRQRVLRSEEEGLMEATAAGIIEAATRSVEAQRIDRPLLIDLQSNTQPDNNAQDEDALHDRVVATPVTSKRHQNRVGTSRRTSASPRVFTGTNLRKQNIAATRSNASSHGFPHASPIQTTQRRRDAASGSRQTGPPAPVGTSSGFHTRPPPLP